MELVRFEIFSEFQLNNFLTDIQITLINGTIKAHKLVLAGSSEFFKALLNSDICKEVSTGIINLPSVEYDVFNYIFDYIYLRSQETILNKSLSFYIDVIEASDYLRMLDLIKIIDLKISSKFLFKELCKEIDRILAFPLIKTKTKFQHQFMDLLNSRNYDDLLHLSPFTISKIIETENFTINENILWEFVRFYFDNIFDTNFDNDCKQNLIDSIRPGLLDNSHLASFYQYLNNYNCLWSKFTIDNLKNILSNLPDENIREMNFYNDSELINKTRSIPYLLTNMINDNSSLTISKLSIVNSCFETDLSIEINSDNYRCHSFTNHLVFINKDWNLNINLGFIINLINYKHCPIPPWQYQINDVDNYYKFWGFSVSLSDTNLYLFGGCYFTHGCVTVPSNKIVTFNFIDKKWKIIPNINLKVQSWSNCVVKDIRKSDTFFISGGRSPQKYLKSFHLIDLQKLEVIDYPNMPVCVSGHSMEMTKNIIIVYGGVWDGSLCHNVLLFDLSSSFWRIISMSNIPDGIHIDYCCRNNTADNYMSNQIMLYDLRSNNMNMCAIYLHTIDLNCHRLDAMVDSRLVKNFSGTQPSNIMCVMSLKFGEKVITISEDIINDVTN